MEAGQIIVTSWGGDYSDSQRSAFYEPFMEETGQTVRENTWNGDLSRIRAWVDTGSYVGHAVDTDSFRLLEGCDEGIWEPIDYDKLGLRREDFLLEAAEECGVPSVAWSVVYAYRRDAFAGVEPQTWEDFWNIDRFPGKRAMEASPMFNLEFALIADGVPASEVNEALSTEDGIDRAFGKLSELKSEIIWWEYGRQALDLLAYQQVVMSTGYNEDFYLAIEKEAQPFEIVWNGQGVDYEYWAIPKDHPELDLAYEFIAFASRPERMSEQTRYMAVAPLVRDAYEYIEGANPDIVQYLPTAFTDADNWFKRDTAFWEFQRGAVYERFEDWRQ